MINESEITKDVNATGGSFNYSKDGDIAQMKWSQTSPTLVIASSTVVPDSMRGQGVGDALLKVFVEDAQKNGYKIIPLCPFVKAKSQKHPEWADVFVSN